MFCTSHRIGDEGWVNELLFDQVDMPSLEKIVISNDTFEKVENFELSSILLIVNNYLKIFPIWKRLRLNQVVLFIQNHSHYQVIISTIDFLLIELPNLEVITIGKGSFFNVNELILSRIYSFMKWEEDLPKLQSFAFEKIFTKATIVSMDGKSLNECNWVK